MNDDLSNALRLQPLSESPQTFAQFLLELKGNENRVGTAPSIVLDSIYAMGKEDYKEESNIERRNFLQLLEKVGIPSWKAFKHVCGSQYFANKLLKRFLIPAAAGGAQLKKMLIVEGGPGAGKDYFKDGIEHALDRNAKVYAVQGCPDHENPLNLLKLLKKEHLAKVASTAGFSSRELEFLLETAGIPCQDCYRKVMGTLDQPVAKPSLAEIKIEKINLSSRSQGVYEWKPGEDCTLVAALRRSNRGFISMPDAFLEREVEPGKADERLLLLDATQYRRLPGFSSDKETTVAVSPLDVFIFASTNKNTLTKFLNTLDDKDAFTGRAEQLKLPYNLILVEEIRAYENEMKRYDKVANFGPLALRMIATLAVLSRYAVPEKGKPFIDPISKMRLLQGEQIRVETTNDWHSIWHIEPLENVRGSAKPISSGYAATAKALPEKVQITPELMWKLIGPDEGLVGLDMRFMMSILSRINQNALSKGKFATVTAFEAIGALRQAISMALSDNNNLTKEQIQVLSRCMKWLKARLDTGIGWNKNATTQPGIIESEYRRLLKQQILQVFCPDYDTRAQDLFEDYVLHATAWATGATTVKHPRHKLIDINEDLLKELDLLRYGKKTGSLDSEQLKFRRALPTYLSDKKDEFMAMECENRGFEPGSQKARDLRIRLAKSYKPIWKSLPELASAIRTKLDEEIGDLIHKLLNTKVLSDLTDKEREKLSTAKEHLAKLGYSKPASAMVLNYAAKVSVWKHN